MGPGPGGPKPAVGLTVITLKHAQVEVLGPVLTKLFPAVDLTLDQRTNQLILRADAKTLEEIQSLLLKLDVEVPKGK